jgi:uncharacterized protein DUF6387
MYPEHLIQFIPPEFDIAKYDKTANMPIELWMLNILIKLVGYKAYETQVDLSSVPQSDLEKVIPALELLIAKGVITELDENFNLMLRDLIDMDKAKYTAQVRELTYYDLFTIIEDLKSGEMEKLYTEKGKSMIPPIAMLLQNKLGKLNETLNIYDKYWENSSSSFLKVDLDCTDSEIKSAFSGWLKQKRSTIKKEVLPSRSYQIKNLNKVTFRKWYDHRVLAYMDLVTWNYVQGNKLTSKIIGDILFPEQRDLKDTTSAVNDTVKPLAAKLTNITTIKRMIKVFAENSRKKIT